ncbi:16432_t:CDS:2, partial [Gigaspora rosea]
MYKPPYTWFADVTDDQNKYVVEEVNNHISAAKVVKKGYRNDQV